MQKVMLENGGEAWSFRSSQYVQAAIKNVEEFLQKEENSRWSKPRKAKTPITTSYQPELDVSPELSLAEAAYFQSLIGVLRWIIKLGQIDICLEVAMMSSCLALPDEGHLDQVF